MLFGRFLYYDQGMICETNNNSDILDGKEQMVKKKGNEVENRNIDVLYPRKENQYKYME